MEKAIRMTDVMSIHEAVKRAKSEGLTISEYTLRYWVRTGAFPVRKVGQKALVYYPNLVRYLSRENGSDSALIPEETCTTTSHVTEEIHTAPPPVTGEHRGYSKQANKEIRDAIKQAGLRQWQIAEAYGIHENNFSRKLRFELPLEEKEKILSIIADLKKEEKS